MHRRGRDGNGQVQLVPHSGGRRGAIRRRDEREQRQVNHRPWRWLWLEPVEFVTAAAGRRGRFVWFSWGLLAILTGTQIAATAVGLLGAFSLALDDRRAHDATPARRQEQHQAARGRQGSKDESAHADESLRKRALCQERRASGCLKPPNGDSTKALPHGGRNRLLVSEEPADKCSRGCVLPSLRVVTPGCMAGAPRRPSTLTVRNSSPSRRLPVRPADAPQGRCPRRGSRRQYRRSHRP